MLSHSAQAAEEPPASGSPPQPSSQGREARSTAGRRGGRGRRRAAPRRNLRLTRGPWGPWSIRTRILVLVLVPSLSLYRAVGRLHGQGLQPGAGPAADGVRDVQRVGVKSETAMVALQEERRLSMVDRPVPAPTGRR